MAVTLPRPVTLDLTGEDAIAQGEDWIYYVWFDYLDTSGPQPVWTTWDLSGHTARMAIRQDYDSSVVLELTTANGRLEVGQGSNGPADADWSLKMHLAASVTSRSGSLADAIRTFGLGRYDCELIDAFGRVRRALKGHIAFDREVTD